MDFYHLILLKRNMEAELFQAAHLNADALTIDICEHVTIQLMAVNALLQIAVTGTGEEEKFLSDEEYASWQRQLRRFDGVLHQSSPDPDGNSSIAADEEILVPVFQQSIRRERDTLLIRALCEQRIILEQELAASEQYRESLLLRFSKNDVEKVIDRTNDEIFLARLLIKRLDRIAGYLKMYLS